MINFQQPFVSIQIEFDFQPQPRKNLTSKNVPVGEKSKCTAEKRKTSIEEMFRFKVNTTVPLEKPLDEKSRLPWRKEQSSDSCLCVSV